MGSIPLALSVHNFISSVGADAGFASIVGLAVLVLLYFAHARETANLREQAAVLTQRLAQAEAQVAHLSRAQLAGSPQVSKVAQPGRPITAPAPSFAAAAAVFPSAPAGVGAPALAAATRVVPVASRPAPQPAVAEQVAQPAMSAQGVPPSALVPASAPALASDPASAPALASDPASPELERPDSARLAAPAPATVAGGNGAARGPLDAAPVGAGPSPPARVQSRPTGGPGAPRRQPPPLRGGGARRSSAGRRFGLLIGALGIVAVIAVLLIATSGGGSTQTSSSAARTTNAPGGRRPASAAAFSAASVTVAVLNGTATNELAHRVATKLVAVGYKQGNVFTASNQTETATVVAYLPGAKNRTDALHVASALRLGAASVQPIDQSTQQVACPPPSACTANVVVTVGADLATL
jgi:hypothetical protein